MSAVRASRVLAIGLLGLVGLVILLFLSTASLLLLVRSGLAGSPPAGAPLQTISLINWGVWTLVFFVVGYAAQRLVSSRARPLEVLVGIVLASTVYGLVAVAGEVVGGQGVASAFSLVHFAAAALGAAVCYMLGRRAAAAAA